MWTSIFPGLPTASEWLAITLFSYVHAINWKSIANWLGPFDLIDFSRIKQMTRSNSPNKTPEISTTSKKFDYMSLK